MSAVGLQVERNEGSFRRRRVETSFGRRVSKGIVNTGVTSAISKNNKFNETLKNVTLYTSLD